MRKTYRIVGSREKMQKGEKGICLFGNPVKVEDKDKLEEFAYKYIVQLFWYLGTRYFIVQKEM